MVYTEKFVNIFSYTTVKRFFPESGMDSIHLFQLVYRETGKKDRINALARTGIVQLLVRCLYQLVLTAKVVWMKINIPLVK